MLSYGRVGKNEFLGRDTQAELTRLTKNFSLVFDDSLNYRQVIIEGRNLRSAFTGTGRVLGVKDSRQLATAKHLGIQFLTNDLKLFKRAKDLGIDAVFIDLNPLLTGPSAAAIRAQDTR